MARTVPVTTYEQAGNLVTSGLWNGGPKALNDFLVNRPMFQGFQAATPAVANNTWTAITMNQANVDTDAGHNTGVNNSRYTVQVGGWYWVVGVTAWNTGAPNNIFRIDNAVARNGGIVAGSSQFQTIQTQGPSAAFCSTLVLCSTGDYLEIWGRQNTGNSWFFDAGSESDGTTSSCYCMMNAVWIRG